MRINISLSAKKYIWSDGSGRLELQLTKAQADSCTHSGQCDDDVADLRNNPAIKKQLAAFDAKLVAKALKEYGTWDDKELSDHDANLTRLLWIATNDVSENPEQYEN